MLFQSCIYLFPLVMLWNGVLGIKRCTALVTAVSRPGWLLGPIIHERLRGPMKSECLLCSTSPFITLQWFTQGSGTTTMEVYLPAGTRPGTMAPNYTAWKVHLWKQISADAKTKQAFPDDHFDSAGLLKLTTRPNHALSSRLVGHALPLTTSYPTDALADKPDESQQIRGVCTIMGTQGQRLVGAVSPGHRRVGRVGPCTTDGRAEGQDHQASDAV